jgi:hypothetical protein
LIFFIHFLPAPSLSLSVKLQLVFAGRIFSLLIKTVQETADLQGLALIAVASSAIVTQSQSLPVVVYQTDQGGKLAVLGRKRST